MGKIREVIIYKSYFDDFFREQSPKVRTKIIPQEIDKAVRLKNEYYNEKEKEKKK